jgi:hypothetical protein
MPRKIWEHLAVFPREVHYSPMNRVTGTRRDAMLALFEWLQTVFATDVPFTVDRVQALAVAQTSPFSDWSFNTFSQFCKLLTEHHYLISVLPPSGVMTYSIPRCREKRAGAMDSMGLAIDGIKSATTDKEATINEIEASGHKNRLIRTAIDILLAVGIVKITRTRPMTLKWDCEEEARLIGPTRAMEDNLRIWEEIKDMDQEIQQLTDEIARRTASLVLPPPESAPKVRDSSGIE